jgi:tetratricopeptide (TPR) repeat protein
LARIAVVHVILGELAMVETNEDLSEAQAHLDEAWSCGFPESVGLSYYYTLQGDLKHRKGQEEQAIDLYEESLDVEHSSYTLIMLAQALSLNGDERAEDAWREVLREDPTNSTAYAFLAQHAMGSGDRQGTIAMAKKAEECHLEPRDVFNLATIYHEVEEFSNAITLYDRADSLGWPAKGEIHAAAGECSMQLGSVDEGRSRMKQAMRHDPENDYVRAICQKYGVG